MKGFADESNITELTILHTNDIHASIDDFGKVAYYINEEREKASHFLYLDAGDFASGNPVVDLNDGKPLVEIFNLVELDAMTIGNHEFDYGQEAFQVNTVDSEFPWLAANMDVGQSGIAQTKPYELFDLDGLTVGVFFRSHKLLLQQLQLI